VSLPSMPEATRRSAREKIDSGAGGGEGWQGLPRWPRRAAKSKRRRRTAGRFLGIRRRGKSAYGKRTLEEQAAEVKPGRSARCSRIRSGFHVLKAEERGAASLATAGRSPQTDRARHGVVEEGEGAGEAEGRRTLAKLRAGQGAQGPLPAEEDGAPAVRLQRVHGPAATRREVPPGRAGYVMASGRRGNLLARCSLRTKAEGGSDYGRRLSRKGIAGSVQGEVERAEDVRSQIRTS